MSTNDDQEAMPRCPHCGAPVDVAHRAAGDRVWCPDCDGWYLVTFSEHGARLLSCEPPVSYPRDGGPARRQKQS